MRRYTYVILIVLVVLILMVLPYFLVKMGWQINESKRETPVPIAISGESSISQILETGSTVEIVEKETTDTNNCNNSEPTEIETQRTRILEHTVVIESQGGVVIGDVEIAQLPILQLVKINLEGKYGVQDKETEQRSYNIKFKTGANKWATHAVAWKYTWFTGNAVVKSPDGLEQIYKYKVRARLEPETTSVEKDCSLLPTAIP